MRLQVWLKQPLVKLDDINARHDAVEAFAGDSELRERLRDQCFRGAQLGYRVYDKRYRI